MRHCSLFEGQRQNRNSIVQVKFLSRFDFYRDLLLDIHYQDFPYSEKN